MSCHRGPLPCELCSQFAAVVIRDGGCSPIFTHRWRMVAGLDGMMRRVRRRYGEELAICVWRFSSEPR